LVGCGGVTAKDERQYRAAGVAEVTGTITFDGQPLAHAQVQFSSGEALNSSFCYGVTDSNGRYRMRINSQRTGALPGDKIVRIWTTMRGDGIDELMQGNVYPTRETIPVEYNRESTLRITVEPNRSQAHNFDLKSGGRVNPAVAPNLDDE
jgi:hypothetical protein